MNCWGQHSQRVPFRTWISDQHTSPHSWTAYYTESQALCYPQQDAPNPCAEWQKLSYCFTEGRFPQIANILEFISFHLPAPWEASKFISNTVFWVSAGLRHCESWCWAYGNKCLLPKASSFNYRSLSPFGSTSLWMQTFRSLVRTRKEQREGTWRERDGRTLRLGGRGGGERRKTVEASIWTDDAHLVQGPCSTVSGPSSPGCTGWHPGKWHWSCGIWWYRHSATHFFFKPWMKSR